MPSERPRLGHDILSREAGTDPEAAGRAPATDPAPPSGRAAGAAGGLLVLLLLLAGATWTAPAQAQRLHARHDGLLDQAQRQGTVRVLVELKLSRPFEAEPPGAGKTASAQRAEIARVRQALLDAFGAGKTGGEATVGRTYETVPFVAMEVDAPALARLLASPLVAGVHENALLRPSLASATAVIGAPAVHASGFDGSGQAIVVIDTGVDADHPFLGGRVVAEACFSNEGAAGGGTLCPNGEGTQVGAGAADPEVPNCGGIDDCAHGTHVAGIAAGAGPDFDGVAPGADVIAIQVFTRVGAEAVAFDSDLMAALEYVHTTLSPAYPIAAVNMSLGGGTFTATCDDHPLKPVIDNLLAQGIATVIAAGNDGYPGATDQPGCISTAITVGATDDTDFVTNFSNIAPWVDLVAPGFDIESSVPGGGFASFHGTSMAAPMVAGAWAVYRQAYPSRPVDEVRRAFRVSGKLVDDKFSGGFVEDLPRIALNAALGAYVLDAPVVTHTNDDGPGSLRHTLAWIEAGETITFSPSLSGQTLTLTSAVLTVSKDVTIDATALADGFTISGGDALPVFVNPSGLRATLKGLTITRGRSAITGGILNAGTLTLDRVTVTGNGTSQSGGHGAGIRNAGTLTLRNSTVSGNSAFFGSGGGLYNSGTATLVASTIYDNSSIEGRQIFNRSGSTLHLIGTVVGGTGLGTDCVNAGTVATNRYSFVQDGSCDTGGSVGFQSGDPLLGALADNGGPTWTHLPQNTSPLIDAGTCDADGDGTTDFIADQRGNSRPADRSEPNAHDGCDVGAVEATIGTFVVVFNTNDSGTGSLRAAVAMAADPLRVVFANVLAGQTITLTSGPIALTKKITIDGSSLPEGLTVSGGGAGRVFDVSGGAVVLIRGLAVTGGTGDPGGGIHNAGTLTLEAVTLSGNATSGFGGGLYNTGALTLVNTTVSGNFANTGGGLYNSGAVHLVGSTFSGNHATSLVHQFFNIASGTAHLVSTVFAGSQATGAQCVSTGTIATNRYVFVQGAHSCGTASGGSPVGFLTGEAMLGALADNGGPAWTHLPLPGSPLLDAGTCDTGAWTGTGLTTDQRGEGRPVAQLLWPDADDGCDIGAVEAGAYYLGSPVVTNTNDDGAGSLRYVLATSAPGATITFDPSLSGQTIRLTSGQLTLSRDVTVDASALDDGVTVDGDETFRVFDVTGGATVRLRALTVIGGAGAPGGGIRNAGTLVLEASVVANNESQGSEGLGGGLYNTGTLTVLNSTISYNLGAINGGGLYNREGTMTVVASTLSGNVTVFGVGSQLRNFTTGTVHLVSSVLAGTSSAPDCGNAGTIATNRYVFIRDGSCDAVDGGTPTGFLSGDPKLNAAADNGGPTWSHLPAPDSPLLDAGTCDTGAFIGNDLTTDQRGLPRPVDDGAPDADDGCDIGSIEAQDAELPVELTSFTATADGEAVVLRWTTASETNNAGFEVQRTDTGTRGDGGAGTWQRLAFVEGRGTTAEGQAYTYRVRDLAPGTHRFRLKQVDYDGAFEYSPEVEVSVEMVEAYRLSAAYPNPFNPQTTFVLSVRRAQEVSVEVYDALGRRVAVLHAGALSAQQAHRFVWEAGAVASGLYFIRARGEDFAAVQRVTLLR